MKRFVLWIEGVAMAGGGLGLFALSFLDSSFLSFPMVSDLLVITMVTQHRDRVLYYALAPALGSLAGCVVLYYVARAGGEAFLRKRFKDSHVEHGLRTLQKYGLLTVIVPALLPPPAPFKIFILLAGVAEIPIAQFATAVFVARLIRFGGEAGLAFFYGEAAATYLKAHAKAASLGLAAFALAAGLIWIWWSRRKRL
jgi:membrane protein YqaA with SNARE-associated domain